MPINLSTVGTRLFLQFAKMGKIASKPYQMALSNERRQRVIELLARGFSIPKVAAKVGCGTTTVSRIKKASKNDNSLSIAKGIARTKKLTDECHEVLAVVERSREHGPQIEAGLMLMFDGLESLFVEVREATDIESVHPRQLPAIAKAAAAVAVAHADYTDRINGLEVLADEVQKINESRSA